MRRIDEIADPNSCLNRAKDDEQVFVLLGRDVAAPEAVRAWCMARVRLGKNDMSDPQIQEAIEWANQAFGQQVADRVAAAQANSKRRKDPPVDPFEVHP